MDNKMYAELLICQKLVLIDFAESGNWLVNYNFRNFRTQTIIFVELKFQTTAINVWLYEHKKNLIFKIPIVFTRV